MISSMRTAPLPVPIANDATDMQVEDSTILETVCDDAQEVSSKSPSLAIPKNSDVVGLTAGKAPPRRVDFITLSSFKKTVQTDKSLEHSIH